METFDGRLRSFNKPKSKSSSKSSSSRAWPHPESFVANPKSLAEAGFFFKPSKDEPDNVRCFICKKELGGWDEYDNPFEIHVNKCPKCPWAIARCSLEFDVDSDGNFSLKDSARLPSNKVLEKARADTFGGKKWWPHDSVKNHGATSKKMAKAGFVYTPQVEGDDTATCFYCDLSLSGWDAEDDPTEEHNKRVERSGKPCPFFQATERPKSQASSKSTRSTSRQSRAPKQAAIPSEEEEEEPVAVKAPGKKGKQKPRETVASSTTSAGLKKSMKPPSIPDAGEESEELEEDDDPSLKVKPAPAPRKSSRKPASKKSKPASKSTGKGKQRMTALEEEGEGSGDEVVAKPARSRSRSEKGKDKGRDNEKEKEKENDKPPSNVDGRIAKTYEDFTVDINAAEGKRKGRGKGEEERQDASRSRSRSRSKPHPTDTDAPRKATLEDSQSRPLLRAASRSRISEIAEAEDEMETEEDATVPSQPSFPAPASPSDFKIAPSKAVKQPVAESRGRPPSPSPEPAPALLPRPTTPEDQILRLGPSKANANTADFRTSLHIPPSPADLFLPPLANAPIPTVAALTDVERAMSVEQWIRHEMAVQYERLKEDGERRIRAFLERAGETRKQIEAL